MIRFFNTDGDEISLGRENWSLVQMAGTIATEFTTRDLDPPTDAVISECGILTTVTVYYDGLDDVDPGVRLCLQDGLNRQALCNSVNGALYQIIVKDGKSNVPVQ